MQSSQYHNLKSKCIHSLHAVLSSWVTRIFGTQTGERMQLKIVLQLGDPLTASPCPDVSTVSQINFRKSLSTITYADLLKWTIGSCSHYTQVSVNSVYIWFYSYLLFTHIWWCPIEPWLHMLLIIASFYHLMLLSSCNWIENSRLFLIYPESSKIFFQVSFKTVPGTEEVNMTCYGNMMKWYSSHILEVFWKRSYSYRVSLSMEGKLVD